MSQRTWKSGKMDYGPSDPRIGKRAPRGQHDAAAALLPRRAGPAACASLQASARQRAWVPTVPIPGMLWHTPLGELLSASCPARGQLVGTAIRQCGGPY